MILLCEDTPRNIANIEHMLLFSGRMERRSNDEPVFKGQKDFDSMVFTRVYLLFSRKDRFELNPVKLRFKYQIREDKAFIFTSDKGVEMLNKMIPIKKETVNDNTPDEGKTEDRTEQAQRYK